MVFQWILLYVALALALAAVDGLKSPLPPNAPRANPTGRKNNSNGSTIHLRVVHFNDVYKLDHLPKFLGYLKHLKKKGRAEDDSQVTKCICTLGGDFFSPSLLSSMDKGKAMVACLSEFVDYACLGNHEADHGSAVFVHNVNNFRGTIINTNFPIVPDTQKSMPSSVTLSLTSSDGSHERRVTLLGLLDATPNLHKPNAFCPGAVENAMTIPEALEGYLRNQMETNSSKAHNPNDDNPTFILPLTHQDVEMDIQLAKDFGCPRRMPLILGGHDHDPFDIPLFDNDDETKNKNRNLCRILKAGMDGDKAIVIDIIWESATVSCPTIEVEFVDIAKLDDSFSDKELERMVHQFHAPLRRLDRTVLKVIESRRDLVLTSMGVRKRQTTMGSLISTALRKALLADVAVLNGGSIRGNTVYTTQAGDTPQGGRRNGRFFTYADLVNEVPYATEMCVVPLPGRVLEAAIDHSRNCGGEQGGGFLQCCDKMDVVQEPSGKYKILQIRGKPFDPNRIYNVATWHHLLMGMDNIVPLVQYCQQNPHIVPHIDATRPAKELVLQVYYREIWLLLDSFDEIDTDRANVITREKLGAALANKFGIDPNDESIGAALLAFDIKGNGEVTREAYDACMHAIQRNRFDLSPQECTGIQQVMDVIKYLNSVVGRKEDQTKEEHQKLLDVMQIERKKAGEVILQQGDTCHSMYFCEAGTIKFIADGKDAGLCGKGGSFGELSLLYDSPRAATCVAVTDCVLWKVDRSAFRYLLVQSANQQNQQIRNVVEYLTAALKDENKRRELEEILRAEQVEAGNAIIQQGDAGDCLYFCERGRIQFTTDGKDVGECGPGGSFGELALWYDSPRAATCVALSACQLWRVDRAAFQHLLSKSRKPLPQSTKPSAQHATQTNTVGTTS